jgi:hypothetical protein
MKVSATTASFIANAVDCSLTIAYLVVIKRNWDILSSVARSDPPSGAKDSQGDVTA